MLDRYSLHGIDASRRGLIAAAAGLLAVTVVARPHHCHHHRRSEAVAFFNMRPNNDTPRSAIRVQCEPACEPIEALAEDVWTEERGPGLPLDIVVTPKAFPRLAAMGVGWQVLIPDIDAVAARERSQSWNHEVPDPDFFNAFHDYNEISEHVHWLAKEVPDHVKLHGIGSSIDGRTIWALQIGHGKTPVMINGAQHAREWISASTTTCIADRMIHDYDKDPRIQKFFEDTTLWVVPVANPDGYQYSWSTSRYWRKNRRGKHGVDLNRNWGVAWGGAGSSGSKGSEIYRGEYAFSEPETAALRDLSKREGIQIHVDFHAYGQLLLYPWNYTAKPSKDDAKLAAIADRMASAIYAQHGKRYTLMPGVELYPSAGTASDWYYGELGALAYTIELRPKGGTGFVLPPEEIKPTCDEGLAALLELRAAAR